MDVGTHLRTARERRGLTIADVAARTKISPRMLRAMEDEDIAALPPPIFVRGFVRAYARELGLEPEPLVAAYAERFAPPLERTLPADEDLADDLVVGSGARDLAYLGDGHPRTNITAALVLAAIALAIVSYLSMGPEGGPAEAPRVAANGEGGASDTAPSVAAVPVGTSGEAMTLEIRPTGPCWVEVRVDGEARIYRLMQGGERETVTAEGNVMLRVGDPTVFAYAINGRPGRPLGITSRPVTVRFTPGDASRFAG